MSFEARGGFETHEVHKSETPCRKCGGNEVIYRVWESSCGGYTDYHYICTACDTDWWIDGIDS